MYALIDGNSFYCSCERAFNPRLKGKPLVVLSNNDGCVISRTHEAKDLGLKMGEPWHMAKNRPEFKDIIAMSSNYALYGDMSRRMYQVLLDHSPQVEPYSIDEMFLDLRWLPWLELYAWAANVRAKVRQIAKIPTCVGIGPTKTIAKLANAIAKLDRYGSGVCDFSTPEARAKAYPTIPIDKVWGLGRASKAKLEAMGVHTVADFVNIPSDNVRQTLTVVGLRTQKELQGISCYPFSLNPMTKKSLACTRSFGRAITEWEEMRQAIVTYISRAAYKLRKHGLAGAALEVFMHTNKFNGDPTYSNKISIRFETTDDTLELINLATKAAGQIYKSGYRYAKAGVIFTDIYEKKDMPPRLFSNIDHEKSARLMTALDAVNLKYGRDTMTAGVMPETGKWSMKRGSLSPCYTTSLEDILTVNAV